MKRIKVILTIMCICLLLVPITAQASDTKSEYFTVSLSAGEHDCVGPGDTFTDTFTVTNTTDKAIKVRVSDVKNIQNSVLYSVLGAGWVNEDGEATYGSFDDLTTDWFEIGPGKALEMTLEMHFPGECGNEYQGTTLNAKFVFETRIPKDSTVTDDGVVETIPDETNPDGDEIPKTGDESLVLMWVVCAGASFCIFLILLWLRKRESEGQA